MPICLSDLGGRTNFARDFVDSLLSQVYPVFGYVDNIRDFVVGYEHNVHLISKLGSILEILSVVSFT